MNEFDDLAYAFAFRGMLFNSVEYAFRETILGVFEFRTKVAQILLLDSMFEFRMQVNVVQLLHIPAGGQQAEKPRFLRSTH